MSALDLSKIRKTRRDMPPRLLIHGWHKVGKSTFASQAPSPIFIQTEDGLDAIDAQAFPLAKTWVDVLDAVAELCREDHKFETVVLDSADWAEQLVQAQVAADNKVESIEGIGYGKGYVYVADAFRELLDGLDFLRTQKNMCVVLIAHSEIKRFDDPMSNAYDRYQIKLHRLIGKMVSEWCDAIGFAQIETLTQTEKGKGFAKDDKRTMAIGTGRRVVHFSPSPSYDAGNRYGLPSTLDLNWASFVDALTTARAASQTTKEQ